VDRLTPQFLVFDNSYFKIVSDADEGDRELLKMSSDRAIFEDDGFRPHAERFRDSQDAFFESYAKAHKRLSELGSKFEPEEGITLEIEEEATTMATKTEETTAAVVGNA